jgi:hypothetical protein
MRPSLETNPCREIMRQTTGVSHHMAGGSISTLVGDRVSISFCSHGPLALMRKSARAA